MAKENNTPSLFRGVMMAYFILIMHVLLIAAMGIMVIFFQGIAQYMSWIFLGGTIAIALFAYYLYRRIKSQGKTFRDILNSALLSGKSVEISLLGGMASLKIDRSTAPSQPAIDVSADVPKLEDPNKVKIRELTELAQKLENDLISPDEYEKAQQKIFKQ